MKPLRISYLLEETAMSGGVRVVMAHADALIRRGHRVRIVTKGTAVDWRPSLAEWMFVDDLSRYDAREEDFVIATFWTTVGVAWQLASTRAVHLCQGYEGQFSYYQDILPRIEATYSLEIPKLVVAQSLVPLVRQFSDDVTLIGQVVEDEFFRSVTPVENRPLRVSLYGQAQADLRGIDTGYAAAAHARSFHQTFELIRVSPWPPAKDEPLSAVSEFHVALTTAEMTRLVHSCDVIIAPNHREEGFGLPAAEAMASGLACVLSSIPSYRSFDEVHDYALFAPERNGVGMGEKLIEVLSDAKLRDRLRTRGRAVAEQWRVEKVADRLEEFFESRRS